MIWTEKYTNPGVPFLSKGRTMQGCDCAGLVLLVLQQEKNISALDYSNYTTADFSGKSGHEHLASLVDKAMAEWPQATTEPRPFDLVRMRLGQARCHVGIYAGGGYFLHVEEVFGKRARLSRISDTALGYKIFEYRRHKDLA